MNIKELIAKLSAYPEDTQVFISSDPEGNSFHYIGALDPFEAQKSNGNGSFDAVVLVPTDREIEEYYGDDE